MRRTYTFTMTKEHVMALLAVMDTMNVRRYSATVMEDETIKVIFHANRDELKKVTMAINKYCNMEARMT